MNPSEEDLTKLVSSVKLEVIQYLKKNLEIHASPNSDYYSHWIDIELIFDGETISTTEVPLD